MSIPVPSMDDLDFWEGMIENGIAALPDLADTLRQAYFPVEELVDEIAGPRGLAYKCTDCDVYGFTSAGQNVVCWCCDGRNVKPR